MPKEEWGTKRLCPTTGKRFYDLNRSPIVGPGDVGQIVERDTLVGVIFQKIVIQIAVFGGTRHDQVVFGIQIVDQNLVVLFGGDAADDGRHGLAPRTFDIHDFA